VVKGEILMIKRGENVEIWEPVNLYDCEIGDETTIGPFVEIQKGVTVGKRCKIQSHSFVCEGVSIGDDVFIGHGVMFTNDRHPKANDPEWYLERTVVESGASIGSGATILPGLTIGYRAMVGAGSVVTKDVLANRTVVGNPAKILRKI
jgi:UDP-2-acetamido-3-amino-2,3-dideoxy-glucuronate N-acetyltransferase